LNKIKWWDWLKSDKSVSENKLHIEWKHFVCFYHFLRLFTDCQEE